MYVMYVSRCNQVIDLKPLSKIVDIAASMFYRREVDDFGREIN